MTKSGQDVRVTLTCIKFRHYPPVEPIVAEFGRAGGTIGRASDNDFVIPDPEHYASRKHARILVDDKDSLMVENNSNNGTIVNDSVELEIGERYEIKEGDVILIGECYIQITKVDSAPPTDESIDSAFRDIFADLDDAEASPSKTGRDSATDSNTAAEHDKEERSNPSASPKPTTTSGTANRTEPDDRDEAVYSVDSEAIDVFLDQLQIDPSTLNEDIVQVMGIAGVALHTLTEGVIEMLKARYSVKKSFHMDTTKIKGVENNALKFSVNSKEALSRLLNEEPGFLSPIQSVQEAVNDAKAHQIAMLSGMTAAIQTILSRFDPEALEKELDQGFSLTSKKARYWEAYKQSYKQIAVDSENDFNQLFAEEFRKTYEEQVRKLKDPK
jgi:predicted component of type VI protein secretion system